MTLIYVLLVAHFVGDFILQSDWMAIHKSKRWDALAFHVLAYGGVLSMFVLWTRPVVPLADVDVWLTTVALYTAVNMAAHFVQDAITSRINAKLWFFRPAMCQGQPQRAFDSTLPWHAMFEGDWREAWIQDGGNRHWFFVGIGADQLLHYVTLFVTASWWLR